MIFDFVAKLHPDYAMYDFVYIQYTGGASGHGRNSIQIKCIIEGLGQMSVPLSFVAIEMKHRYV